MQRHDTSDEGSSDDDPGDEGCDMMLLVVPPH